MENRGTRFWAAAGVIAAIVLLLVNIILVINNGNQTQNRYDETGQHVQTLEQRIADLESLISGGDVDDNILAELRDLKERMNDLEQSTNSALSAYNVIHDSVVYINVTAFGGSSSGSGFVLTSDGYIITSQHVINNARSITVTLHDGTATTATMVRADFSRDVALLKITVPAGTTLTPAKLGSVDSVKTGHSILVVGYPEPSYLGRTEMSAFYGIVSAIKETSNANQSTTKYTHIQADAAMNSGNSGGPVVNMSGEVIGIVSWGYDYDLMEDVGFALATNEIVAFLQANGFGDLI